jgi:hypothetical protein
MRSTESARKIPTERRSLVFLSSVNTLKKLQQTGPDSVLKQLAEIAAETWFETPIKQLVSKTQLSEYVFRALSALSQSTQQVNVVERLVEHVVSTLNHNSKRIGDMMPLEFHQATEQILERPFSPSKHLVTAVLDTAPMRELFRQLLAEAIADFTKRASAPVATVAKGFGAFARMAQDTVKNRGGALGSLVGSISEGVEQQVEQRSAQLFDAAISKSINQLADFISNPQHADEAAEIRVALFESVAQLPSDGLSKELINLDVPGAAQLILQALKKFLARPDARGQIEKSLEHFEAFAAQSPKHWLELAGLFGEAQAIAQEALEVEFRRVIQNPKFEVWLSNLLRHSIVE